MKRLTAGFLVILALLCLLSLAACTGGAEEVKDVRGFYSCTSLDGYSDMYLYNDIGAGDFYIELKSEAKCTVFRNNYAFPYKWELSGTTLTLSSDFEDGEDPLVYTGTLENDTIKICFVGDLVEVYTLK